MPSTEPCTRATPLMVMAVTGMQSSTQQRRIQRREATPSLGPCATPERTPAAPGSLIIVSSAPLGYCAQHTFSKSSWFLLMKSCLSSTQCESCLTKNIAQSAFQSGTKEPVLSNHFARAVFFSPSLFACQPLVNDTHPCQLLIQRHWGQSCQENLTPFSLSLTTSTFFSLNNPGPAFWGLRSDHTGKK